jgi:hypothetical protein
MTDGPVYGTRAFLVESLVIAVRAHALAHYDEVGWDIVVETMEDEDIARAFGQARSIEGAIRRVQAYVEPAFEMRAEAIAEGGE